MSESLRDLVVSLSLQTDNFTRNIKSVNKQIKEAESNFKLASAGVENFEQTASGLSSHLSTLERKLTLQRQVVTQYEQALQAANSKLSECYNRQNDYAKRLEQARAAQASLKEQVREAAAQVREYTRTLGESDAATENARGALDALKAEYLEAVQNVRKLAGQNTALQKSTLNAADAVTTARTNLNNASAAVRITETDIQKCNAALALAETNWEQATQAIKAGESALSGIGQQIRLAESNFTLAAASIENVETSVDGLSARMIMLEERYRLQTNAVTQYQNILESTKEQLEAAAAAKDPAKVEEATRAVTEAQIALNHAQSAVEKTKLELEDCNQALALANTQWYSAGEAFSKAETAIARIGQQIQLTESEFRLAVVGMKDVESSTDGLGKKADMLSTKWLHLMDVVSQSQKALNAAYDRLAAANEAGDSDLIEKAEADVIKARTALNNARAASEEAYFELQRCRNELDLFADGWYDAGDSIEKSKSALGAINKQLQQAQSRFKIASAGIKDIDKSAQGLSAKLTLLKEKFDLQKKALQQYEYALSAAQIRLEIAQNANDPEKIQKATDEVLEAETALIGATAALKETEAEIEACNRALKTAQSAWTAAGNSLESFSKTCDKVSKGMATAGRALTTVMTAPIIALGTAAVKASISYETAFTSVRKTVDATEAEFAQLSGEIKQMSTEVATSADDIAEVVAIAGQLGIANEYLTSFSKTMIDLGNSTDIVAEEAASTLAKFANITGMDQSQFSNLGATLVDLGNNYATTESAIMNMAMRLAAAGDQVGLSESQILGFAAALSSVGIEAEMGGSAFSKALIKMEVASATGGQALEDFAMVSGMTADQFKALWDADPAGAFQAFIEGLAKMDDEGMSAIATLEEIGIAEIRLRDTLLRAVNANELFTETQITALDQIAAIQEFLTNRETELPGLASMFGEALPEEILTIATDLDMTGAQARWDEFAANPGAITTDAIIASYDDQQALLVLQPQVDAYISKYTEIPEGADTASLTPTGMVAYVTTYAEVTTGADVSGLNPTNVVAMVSAYDELASGTDISLLHPDEITAYVMEYCEANGVDISGLAPEGVTAFVMAYEEITGGAVTSALTPSDVTAMVCKYLEAEGIDISALSPDQVEAIVSAYAEATGCDKDALMQDFTATIVAYDDTNAVKPKLNITVSITGYDLAAYNEFVTNNPVEVEGRVRLGEVYENPQDVLSASNAQFYVDGQQVEVSAVPAEQITADTLFVYDTDGTMHVLITPEVQGTPEALEAAEALLHSTEHQGSIGARWLGDDTLKDLERCNEYLEGIDGEMNSWLNVGGWMNRYDRWAASSTFSNYFDPTEIGNIQAYVAEAVAAINSGQQLDETTIANLQSILHMVELLDSIGIGQNVTAGIAEGMTEAGWDTDAETVASNLEAAINLALGIESPAKRMKPAGDQVAAGIGVGMTEHDMSTDAATLATGLTGAVEAALPPDALSMLGTSAAAGLASALSSYNMGTAGRTVGSNAVASVSSSLNSTSLRSIGVNAMRGLVAGINAGRSGVISAMRSAARAAVNAAKAELQIRSPSAVFEDEVGVQAMRGLGLGVLKESKEQARVVRNAARYLTDEARDAAIVSNSNDNRRTYNQNVSSTIQVDKLYVRDEQDVRSLAVEIATLTRRQQRGKGLRFA